MIDLRKMYLFTDSTVIRTCKIAGRDVVRNTVCILYPIALDGLNSRVDVLVSCSCHEGITRKSVPVNCFLDARVITAEEIQNQCKTSMHVTAEDFENELVIAP